MGLKSRCNNSVFLARGLQCVRENLCRPYGTRVHFPLDPAVKRWAMIFRPSGAGWWANITMFAHRNFENEFSRTHFSPGTDTKNPAGRVVAYPRRRPASKRRATARG